MFTTNFVGQAEKYVAGNIRNNNLLT